MKKLLFALTVIMGFSSSVFAQCSPDLSAPIPDSVSLPDIIAQCSAIVTVSPTATDTCAGVIIGTTSDPLSYSTQGTHVIHWSFDDGNGNISMQNQNVIITDMIAPVADSMALPDVTAQCSATVTMMPTATDNCVGAVIGTTSDPLTYSTQGTHVIHWSFNDGHGNVSMQNQNVIIMDTIAPMADSMALPNVTAQCSATVTMMPTATDNCIGAVVGTTSDPLTYSTQGTHVIHWTYDDGHGNTSMQNQNVIITDMTAPIPDSMSLPAVTGECSATVTMMPTATDNCVGVVIGTTTDLLTYSTQGTHVIHWTYDDGHGNTSMQNQNVIIMDTIAPMADSMALPDVTGQCSAMVTMMPTATDNCIGAVVGTTTDSLSYSTQGTHVIHWMYTDGHGNISMQNQNVIIMDTIAPMADSMALPNVVSLCSATVTTVPTATDNCVGGTITGTTTDPLTYSMHGTHVIHWTFDDGHGNMSMQNQNVIITDSIAPVADADSLADIIVQCSAHVSVIPTATDNCAGAVTGTTTDPLIYTTQGTHVIHWTFDDGHGNMSMQTQNVMVMDIVAPTADSMSLPDVTGECSATVTTMPTAHDNCVGMVIGTTTDSLTYTTQGTHTIHWIFSDGHGNSVTQDQHVVIMDITAPVADSMSLPDVTGACSVTVTTMPTATDNCAGTVWGIADTTTFNAVGTHTITWTYNDGNGHSITQTQHVIVYDTVAPVVPVLADITGDCSITPAIPATIDACTGVVTGTTTTVFPITTVGTTTVTWTFDDGHDNISTAIQHVTINADTTKPLTPVIPDTTAECSVYVTAPTTTDNCAGTITGTTDSATFYSSVGGPYLITWKFDDGHGNVTYATQNVYVTLDMSPPMTPTLPDLIGCYVVAPVAQAFDACTGWVDGTTSDSLTYSTIGTDTIHWTFADEGGHTTTATQIVHVIADTVAPILPVLTTVTGTCSVTVPAPVTSDVCAGAITGTTTTVFPITSSQTITWVFNDMHGNIDSTTQSVIVNHIDTSLTVSGATFTANATGVTYAWFNCGSGSVISGQTSQTFTASGNGSYALIVTNGSCVDTSSCYSIFSTGIAATNANSEVLIYPNPTSGLVTINLATAEKTNIIVRNVMNQIVFEQRVESKQTTVDLSKFDNGMFFINVQTSSSNRMYKITKTK